VGLTDFFAEDRVYAPEWDLDVPLAGPYASIAQNFFYLEPLSAYYPVGAGHLFSMPKMAHIPLK
jgi:hypothetical protein